MNKIYICVHVCVCVYVLMRVYVYWLKVDFQYLPQWLSTLFIEGWPLIELRAGQ